MGNSLASIVEQCTYQVQEHLDKTSEETSIFLWDLFLESLVHIHYERTENMGHHLTVGIDRDNKLSEKGLAKINGYSDSVAQVVEQAYEDFSTYINAKMKSIELDVSYLDLPDGQVNRIAFNDMADDEYKPTNLEYLLYFGAATFANVVILSALHYLSDYLPEAFSAIGPGVLTGVVNGLLAIAINRMTKQTETRNRIYEGFSFAKETKTTNIAENIVIDEESKNNHVRKETYSGRTWKRILQLKKNPFRPVTLFNETIYADQNLDSIHQILLEMRFGRTMGLIGKQRVLSLESEVRTRYHKGEGTSVETTHMTYSGNKYDARHKLGFTKVLE